MISFDLARKLKDQGLTWYPVQHDFFAIPDRGFDDQVFVISDVQSSIENILGSPVVAFQGASEWALDYLVTTEAVWMPTEEQIRSLLEDHLLRYRQAALIFSWSIHEYTCNIAFDGKDLTFEGGQASDVYALALLYLLGNEKPPAEG
ncbi:MAG: pilus assembly protein CpaE [Chloroflexi bacterium]|nr:MAG: pilus assembly protein CpaE [Chloroflexota bacterium]